MKCLFVNPDYPPPMVGGSIVYFYYMHSSFSGDELCVLTSAAAGSPEFDAGLPYKVVRKKYIRRSGIDEHHLPKAINLARQFFAAWHVTLKERIGLIHMGQLYPAAFLGWLLSAVTGRPYVLSVMGEELTGLRTAGPIRRQLTLLALRRASQVFTISKFTQGVLLGRGVGAEKITVFTPGIDLGKCDPENIKEPDIVKGLRDKNILLTVGRLTERKGQDMVLKALPLVLKDFPATHYIVAGDGLDAGRLKNITAELGLEGHVTIATGLSDEEIAYLYKHCQLFVMPNRELPNGDTEGFGIVFLEAGWWGKPVIGGNAGGAPDAIDDGVTGVLVDGKSRSSIAAAIRSILQDPEKAGVMGAAGREKARGSDWRVKSDNYKAKIRDLCLKPGGC